jgi:hypothetical protein
MMDPLHVAEPFSNLDEEIDNMVPPKVMRLTQHLHNLIYIRYFYESIGQQPPDWVKLEMQRSQTILLSELDREHGQGGAFKIKGAEHEAARKSGQERSGKLESGAKVQGGFARRR